MTKRTKSNPLAALAIGASSLIAAGAGATAGWIAYSNRAIDHGLPLPNAVDAERQTIMAAKSGQLSFYLDRTADGRPLLLIHSINAAGSAYEMRPLFERYRAGRPVYALDLPGFGFSERSKRAYSPQLYEEAILEFLSSQIREPVDVIALSLGCEFAARAALSEPAHFRTLAFISPSGLRRRKTGRATQQANDLGASSGAYTALSNPLWGRALFDLIATRASIELFLRQSFVGPVDAGLAEYAYLTSHQWGAQHAPLHFLSGKLFTRDIAETIYGRLNVPVLVLYDADAYTDFSRLQEVQRSNTLWQARRISPTLGLPHFEKPGETCEALDAFWAGQ